MNRTNVAYFILSAYVDTGVLKYLFFFMVLFLYVLIICCNVVLIVVICVHRSLHEPMYMFLCSLFVAELYGSSGLFPFLLVQILSDVHTISIPLCFLQDFCLYSYGSVEFFTLAVMSYDRYVAICCPLRYNTLMTTNKIVGLVVVIWCYPFFTVVILISMTARLQLCGNIITGNKIYCDNPSILKLACSNVTINNIYGIFNMFQLLVLPVVLILYTYMSIIKVCISGSKQTRQKAVSTCTPHLISLFNFFFGCFLEIVGNRLYTSNADGTLRVLGSSAVVYLYTCQTLFNPLLYGLKTSKIRSSFKTLVDKILHQSLFTTNEKSVIA